MIPEENAGSHIIFDGEKEGREGKGVEREGMGVGREDDDDE